MWTDPMSGKRYPLADVLRLLCACAVVSIHLAPEANIFTACISRQAVPFFFITSGFFFSRKLEAAGDKRRFVLDFAKRIVWFYFAWTAILLPHTLAVYARLYQGRPLYIAFVLIRRIFLAGTEQFWYLLALGEAALIAGLLLISGRERLLYGLGAAGFLLGVVYALELPFSLFRQYNRVVHALFSWEYNFLMQGVPFFTLGILLSRREPQAAVPGWLLLTGVSLWLYPVLPELALILCPLQAALLFGIGIRMKANPFVRKVSPYCRDVSAAVYCLHGLAAEYILGELIPWSECYTVNCLAVIAVCSVLYAAVRIIGWKPLYRLITLQ